MRALSKNSAPQRVTLDLNQLIRETLSLLDREIAESGASVRLVLQPALPDVSVDRIQVQQVIINLIMNALQAMDAVDARELRIASRRAAGGMIEMAVSDSGVGLTAETMSRLFTSFYTTKSQGMGMGLSICRSIVESQGGKIRAERNAVAGATFIVSFPQEAA